MIGLDGMSVVRGFQKHSRFIDQQMLERYDTEEDFSYVKLLKNF